MRGKSRLTDNAIMYISVGFQQHCLLQVLSLRHTPSHALEMVVYDGTVYAGAIYRPPHVLLVLPSPEQSQSAEAERVCLPQLSREATSRKNLSCRDSWT